MRQELDPAHHTMVRKYWGTSRFLLFLTDRTAVHTRPSNNNAPGSQGIVFHTSVALQSQVWTGFLAEAPAGVAKFQATVPLGASSTPLIH